MVDDKSETEHKLDGNTGMYDSELFNFCNDGNNDTRMKKEVRNQINSMNK